MWQTVNINHMNNTSILQNPQVKKYLVKKDSQIRQRYFQKFRFVKEELSFVSIPDKVYTDSGVKCTV